MCMCESFYVHTYSCACMSICIHIYIYIHIQRYRYRYVEQLSAGGPAEVPAASGIQLAAHDADDRDARRGTVDIIAPP